MYPTFTSFAFHIVVFISKELLFYTLMQKYKHIFFPESLKAWLSQTLTSKYSFLRPSVWHIGAGVVCSVHRGGEGERAPHGGESSADGRRLWEAEELAERRLPQTDDWRLQGDERGWRRLPQGSEALGEKTQRGLDFRLVRTSQHNKSIWCVAPVEFNFSKSSKL